MCTAVLTQGPGRSVVDREVRVAEEILIHPDRQKALDVVRKKLDQLSQPSDHVSTPLKTGETVCRKLCDVFQTLPAAESLQHTLLGA